MDDVAVALPEVEKEQYDTSDPIEVNKARKRSARTRADRLKFVEAAMTMPEGRAWFYDFLMRCHIFSTPFNEDPYIHAYRAGEANVGLQVLSDIQETAAQSYVLMVQENKSKRE
jgi:hypothetical protein